MKWLIYGFLLCLLCSCQRAKLCVTKECQTNSTLQNEKSEEGKQGNQGEETEGTIVELPEAVKIIDDFSDPTGEGATRGFRIDVTFASGSYDLAPEFKQILQDFATYLLAKNFSKIIIHGHTDSVGAPENNQILSDERALSVKTFLRTLDFLSNLEMSSQGKGETNPIADNSTEEGRQRNRRIEIYTIP